MVTRKSKKSANIVNRRAKYDYELGDSFVMGLQLTGAETKALRLGHGQLQGSYVTVKDDELWLMGAQIHSSQGVPITEQDQTRNRKLLAKRREIDKFTSYKQQGMSIVPLEIMTGGRYIKLRVAIGRGKKRIDKRETIKRRQQQRDARHVLN